MRRLKWVFSVLIILGIIAFFMLPRLNNYQIDGETYLAGIKKPVKVIRDEKGMAYIFGKDLYDVIKAQGYVTAQDRLFQMHLTRVLIRGKMSEFFGEETKEMDIIQRTLGFYRAAEKHARILDEHSRKLLQAYTDGVNEYIKNGKDTHHLEFGLTGLEPDPWELTDTIAIMYYMGWGSAANIQTEITSQMLIDKVGYEKFITIFPVNINPDEVPSTSMIHSIERKKSVEDNVRLNFIQDSPTKILGSIALDSIQLGSNNWAVGSQKSPGGKPIMVNDPHLSTKILPTLLYPTGMFTPELRAVGVTVPGIPCLMMGRNEYVAVGITNAYGDAQDLYIETIDPNNPANYLEGKASIPFKVIKQTLKIKDKEEPNGFRMEKFNIRLTKRGPVISNVLKGLKTEKLVTVRWAPMESMQPSLGLDCLLKSKSVGDIKNILKDMTAIHLNYVFADIHGDIAWQTTGRIPIRSKGNGSVPFKVTDDRDNWSGWIPYEEMPQNYQPERGWVGTANHKPVTKDYPYYYSSWFAPSYRYQRMTELLDPPGKKTVDDHWKFMRDDLNVLSRVISPILAKALIAQPETRKMGEILTQWDFRDKIDSPAPSIFQETYRNLAGLVFKDELGEEIGSYLIGNNYFWQERLGIMINEGKSEWFDDITTPDKKETLTDLIQKAGIETLKDLSERIGDDPEDWLWGEIHQIEFLNPIRRSELGKGRLGGGSHPMGGSGDTIYRALFLLNHEGNIVKYSAALRMVADLSDNEKVLAVIPGGVDGRTFSPHFTDQIEAYMSGEKMYWWFSDEKIKEHADSELHFKPRMSL